jgi:hypothetical protein
LWLLPLIALVIVAVGVVFILPDHIDVPALQSVINSEPASPASGNISTNVTQSSKPSTPEASPFQEAQDARARNQSQELLSEVLKLQEELEEKNVLIWGADKYNSILDLAREGDAAYRTRDFALSTSLYRETQSGLQNLQDEMETIFTEALAQAEEALNNGNSKLSSESFEFALLIKPDNENALTGLARTKTLDEVLELITEGNNLQQNNDFEGARDKFQQALALDKHTQQAKEKMKLANQQITDRDFNRLMSEGYRWLQQKDLEKARLSFQKANRLKPNATEVASAINQTQTGITNQKISDILDIAIQMEQEEKWSEAVKEYDKALALDSSLAKAQEGKQFSQNRADLDSRLDQIITNPERLSNKSVFEEARLIYQNASTISNPQPKLSQQLNNLSNLLESALNPVVVIFKSDNMTDVTINRIGILGKFEEQSMSLLPGNYVAIGTREGYRDVRVEFTIQTGQTTAQDIIISAIEKIASR